MNTTMVLVCCLHLQCMILEVALPMQCYIACLTVPRAALPCFFILLKKLFSATSFLHSTLLPAPFSYYFFIVNHCFILHSGWMLLKYFVINSCSLFKPILTFCEVCHPCVQLQGLQMLDSELALQQLEGQMIGLVCLQVLHEQCVLHVHLQDVVGLTVS